MPAPIPREALFAFTPEQQRLLSPLIENVEMLTGMRPNNPPIDPPPPGASLGDVIILIKRLLARMQG